MFMESNIFPKLKKIIFTLTFKFSLFLILMIGIQNSTKKENIYLLNNESVQLPISFIIGISFISGSIASGFLNLSFKKD